MVALSGPMTESYPGYPVDNSPMTPKPAEWWLRPVMSAARVGEHRAVECMQVYRSPALATRSSAGVGMTPPNVLGAPKPTSSVMINNTLGAPLGGTTRGAHHAFDWAAFSLNTPPNLGSGAGSCFPSIVVVALAEPRTPVTSCAGDEAA